MDIRYAVNFVTIIFLMSSIAITTGYNLFLKKKLNKKEQLIVKYERILYNKIVDME